MLATNSRPTLVNATITHNLAGLEGGGRYLVNASLTAVSSIVAYNNASTGGNFFTFECFSDCRSTVSLSHSNLYNPDEFGTDNLTPTGTYTTVDQVPPTPVFVDPIHTKTAVLPGQLRYSRRQQSQATRALLPDQIRPHG